MAIMDPMQMQGMPPVECGIPSEECPARIIGKASGIFEKVGDSEDVFDGIGCFRWFGNRNVAERAYQRSSMKSEEMLDKVNTFIPDTQISRTFQALAAGDDAAGHDAAGHDAAGHVAAGDDAAGDDAAGHDAAVDDGR
eukprot:gene10005-biopygen9372